MEEEFQYQGKFYQELEYWLSPRGIQHIHSLLYEEEKHKSIWVKKLAPEL